MTQYQLPQVLYFLLQGLTYLNLGVTLEDAAAYKFSTSEVSVIHSAWSDKPLVQLHDFSNQELISRILKKDSGPQLPLPLTYPGMILSPLLKWGLRVGSVVPFYKSPLSRVQAFLLSLADPGPSLVLPETSSVRCSWRYPLKKVVNSRENVLMCFIGLFSQKNM